MKKNDIPNKYIKEASVVNPQIEPKETAGGGRQGEMKFPAALLPFKLKSAKRCRKGVRIELRRSTLSGSLVGILKG